MPKGICSQQFCIIWRHLNLIWRRRACLIPQMKLPQKIMVSKRNCFFLGSVLEEHIIVIIFLQSLWFTGRISNFGYEKKFLPCYSSPYCLTDCCYCGKNMQLVMSVVSWWPHSFQTNNRKDVKLWIQKRKNQVLTQDWSWLVSFEQISCIVGAPLLQTLTVFVTHSKSCYFQHVLFKVPCLPEVKLYSWIQNIWSKVQNKAVTWNSSEGPSFVIVACWHDKDWHIVHIFTVEVLENTCDFFFLSLLDTLISKQTGNFCDIRNNLLVVRATDFELFKQLLHTAIRLISTMRKECHLNECDIVTVSISYQKIL